MSVVRYVDNWGHGGFMARGFPGDPSRPPSDLHRAAVAAFAVAASGEPGFGTPQGISQASRDELSELLQSGVRVAVVDDRDNGADRTDMDRSRLLLATMSLGSMARQHIHGFPYEELPNPILEGVRVGIGLDERMLSNQDAHRIAVGLYDMIAGPESAASVVSSLASCRQSAGAAVESVLEAVLASWPTVDVQKAQSLMDASPAVSSKSADLDMATAFIDRSQGR